MSAPLMLSWGFYSSGTLEENIQKVNLISPQQQEDAVEIVSEIPTNKIPIQPELHLM